MRKVSNRLSEENTSYYSSSRASKASTKWDWVLDVDVRLDRELSLVVAS